MPNANNKGAYQPAYPRSLISTFVIRCLDSMLPLVSISKISSLYLASVAEQAGLCLTLSPTLNTDFLVTWLSQALTTLGVILILCGFVDFNIWRFTLSCSFSHVFFSVLVSIVVTMLGGERSWSMSFSYTFVC